MILTITLNTSIDKAYQLVSPLEVGTVMRLADCADSAGGKGLNASRAIASCGEEVLATGFVGGHNGSRLVELLKDDGIGERFVRTASETRSCVNVLEPGGRSTEFLEPGGPVTQAELEHLAAIVAELLPGCDAVCMSGSLPPGAPADTWRQLVALASGQGIPVVLDCSGEGLASALEADPAVLPAAIKPNADEVAELTGADPSNLGEVRRAAEGLHQRGVADVIVSLGARGALLVSDAGCLYGRPPHIDAINPVGSGDTLVGAYAVGLVRRLTPSERLRHALACATANCLSPSTGLFDPAVAKRLAGEVQIERLD